MWGKITIQMDRLWLHGLYGLYGPRCLLSPERPLNLITHSLMLIKKEDPRTFCDEFGFWWTHWGFNNESVSLVSVDSGNDLELTQYSFIIKLTLGTNLNENLILIKQIIFQETAFENFFKHSRRIHLKMSAKWWPFCSSVNQLNTGPLKHCGGPC